MNKQELKSLLENIYEAMILPTLGDQYLNNPGLLNPTPTLSSQSSPMELEVGLRFDTHYPYPEPPPKPKPPPKPTPQWHWEWDGTNLRYWLLPIQPHNRTHGWGQE